MSTRKFPLVGVGLTLAALAAWFGPGALSELTSRRGARMEPAEEAESMAEAIAFIRAETQHVASPTGEAHLPVMLHAAAGEQPLAAATRGLPVDSDVQSRMAAAMMQQAEDLTGPLAERWAEEPEEDRLTEFHTVMREAVDAALVETDVPGSKVISMECRTTLCRTELQFESSAAMTFMKLGARVIQNPIMATTTGKHYVQGDRAIVYTIPGSES